VDRIVDLVGGGFETGTVATIVRPLAESRSSSGRSARPVAPGRALSWRCPVPVHAPSSRDFEI